MTKIPAYRVTVGDLPGLDKKLAAALQPLLNALNICLKAAIVAVNAIDTLTAKSVTFIASPNGSAYVELSTGAPMTDVVVSGLTPNSGTLQTVWAMSWIPTGTGARLLFVGLEPSQTYSLRVRCQ